MKNKNNAMEEKVNAVRILTPSINYYSRNEMEIDPRVRSEEAHT